MADGVLLGRNLVTGAPVFYDSYAGPPVLQNPHLGIIATSGAGKTTFLKVLAARSAVLGVRTVGLFSLLVDEFDHLFLQVWKHSTVK